MDKRSSTFFSVKSIGPLLGLLVWVTIKLITIPFIIAPHLFKVYRNFKKTGKIAIGSEVEDIVSPIDKSGSMNSSNFKRK